MQVLYGIIRQTKETPGETPMNAQKLLEQLLQSGRELTEKGKTLAEEKLDIPEAGEKREAMLSGMGKGALAAGALALLLGTKGGRKVTGGVLKLGSLAAVGGVAWKVYNDWQAKQGDVAMNVNDKPVAELAPPQAEQRSLLLLRAMIAAAKADGHIDAAEQEKINVLIEHLDLDSGTLTMMTREMAKPVAVEALAADVDSTAAAAEVYMTSLMVIDSDQPAEREHLNELAAALKLNGELVTELETEAKKV